MFTILEKLNQRQETMQDTLNQVLSIDRGLASGSSDQTSLPDGLNLPVDTVEEVEAVEEKLADEAAFSALVIVFQIAKTILTCW